MSKPPFAIDNDSHILSQFNARMSCDSEVRELRLTLNGWTSQMLLHNNPYYSQLTADDLTAYAASKNVPVPSALVQAVASTISNSRQLYLQQNTQGQWSLTTNIERELAFAALTSDEIKAKFFPVYTTFYTGKYPRFKAVGAGDNISAATPFVNWNGLSSDAIAELKAITNDAYMTDPSFNEDALRDPVTLFRQVVAKCLSISVDEVVVVETGIGLSEFSDDGFTYVLSPSDHQDQQVKCRVPRLGFADAVEFGRYTTSNGASGNEGEIIACMPSASSASGYALRTLSLTSDQMELFYGTATPKFFTNRYNADDAIEGISPSEFVSATWRATDSGDSNLTIMTPPASILAKIPYTSLKNLSVGDDPQLGSWDISFIAGVIVLEDVFLALPTGFYDILLDSASITTTDSSSSYMSDVITMTGSKLRLGTSMLAVRNYLEVKVEDPTLSTSEKSKITSAITDSAKYADALLRCSISASLFSYPASTDISSLKLVEVAKDADVDLMTEDLGEGITLKSIALKFDNLRSKSSKYWGATRLIDDAADKVTLLSSTLGDVVDPSQLFIDATVEDEELVQIFAKTEAGSTIALSTIDAQVLLSMGCLTAETSDWDRATLIAHYNLTDEVMLQLSSLAPSVTDSYGATAYEGMDSIDYTKIDPSEFVDEQGYPVLLFMDTDTSIRSAIAHKGFGDDPINTIVSMFFVNQMDIEY